MSVDEGLINLIHAEVQRYMHRSSRRTPVVVDGYDPKTHAAKFKLMPDSKTQDVITGWIPLHTSQTGNKSGMYMPPNIGDHGWIEFHDDDREGGTFTHAAFNDKFPPDDTVKAGEFKYIQPNTQAQIYADNDGNVIIRGMNNSKSGNSKGGSKGDGNGGSDNSKQAVVLKKDGSTVITDKSGSASITLDGNGNITLKATKITHDGKVLLGATDASDPVYGNASGSGMTSTNVFVKATDPGPPTSLDNQP